MEEFSSDRRKVQEDSARQASHLREQIASLGRSLSDTEQKLVTETQVRVHAREELARCHSTIEKMDTEFKNERKSFHSIIAQSEESLSSQQSRYEEEHTACRLRHERAIAELNERLIQFPVEIDRLLTDFQKEREGLVCQAKRLEAVFAEQKGRAENAENALVEARGRLAREIQEVRNAAANEREAQSAKIQSLESRLEMLQAQHEKEVVAATSALGQSLQAEKDALLRRLEEKERECVQQSLEYAALVQSYEALSDHVERYKTESAEREQLVAEISTLGRRIAQVEERERSLLATVDEYRAEGTNLKGDLCSALQGQALLREQLTAETDAIAQVRLDFERVQADKAALEQRILVLLEATEPGKVVSIVGITDVEFEHHFRDRLDLMRSKWSRDRRALQSIADKMQASNQEMRKSVSNGLIVRHRWH